VPAAGWQLAGHAEYARLDFIERANRDKNPFFVWFNTSRMHIWTHLTPGAEGKTGVGVYPDGMVEHDGQVGELLMKLARTGTIDESCL
jgi:arylsulfatase